ncbi:ATP-binding cassette domain-containing protein [Kocuria sabuli]|uniref:ATP-binding cassette domain-containing protein n=1 Tax=Kocuria sabuli TaxID=3071448 RepID=UPI0034D5AE7C
MLEDLDLTVPPGQTLTVLGGNGAGKSTFPRGRPSWPWPSVSTQPQPPLRH